MTALARQAVRRVQARMLDDGRRLHLQDGPIDLVIEAFGPREAVTRAYEAAHGRLVGLLDDLCDELPALRRAVEAASEPPAGPVARRMFAAVRPFTDIFITPMAAVAGAVADQVLAAMLAATGGEIERAYVNNGGDIALHLAPGTSFVAGLVDRPDRPGLFATATIAADDAVGGIATSGVHGRSFSLGIADAVTILARTAAEADAAATVVANAVDLPHHPGIVRRPARDIAPDSDLGPRPVTRLVPPLLAHEVDAALDAGALVADALRRDLKISAAALHLRGTTRLVGPLAGRLSRTPPCPHPLAHPRHTRTRA